MNPAVFLSVAASVWGGQTTPTIEWHESLVATEMVEGHPLGTPLGGIAWTDENKIQLSATWWRSHRDATARCNLIVHEYGHLHGLDHSHPGMEDGHRFRACLSFGNHQTTRRDVELRRDVVDATIRHRVRIVTESLYH